MEYNLLNLACGSKISNIGNWTNVDFKSPKDNVIELDILKGLPFPVNFFDAVYSAQFIEHLTLEEGLKVLRNVATVMKPGGIIRLVTPDFEELALSYLRLLGELKLNPNENISSQYDWIRLEIFDQIVRDRSGGETPLFLANADDSTKKFILERIGHTANTFFYPQLDLKQKLFTPEIFLKLNRIPHHLWRITRNFFATDTIRIGRFRRSGEVHRYMHDVYSLTSLLQSAGFNTVERVNANQSSIPNWSSYELDCINGVVDGPLSLYLEARL